jgi:hypothetical protein
VWELTALGRHRHTAALYCLATSGRGCRGVQARAALATAITLYRAMEMTFWLPQVEAALAQVE